MSELSRSLKPRHIAMISIGGIIGAGLFVSSSAAIAAAGPAIVLSYLITGTLVLLVMRMLGEMAVAMPKYPLVHGFSARGARALGGVRGRVAVLVFLGDHRAGGGDRRGQHSAPVVSGVVAAGAGTRVDGGDDGREPDVGALVRGVRVLVLLDQGRGDHCVHRAGGGLTRSGSPPRRGRRSGI